MTTFVMKGYKGKAVHASMSHTPLEIKGNWHIQGMQPVDEDGTGEGVPRWIYDLLELNPDIETISIGRKNTGVVYAKID